MCGFVISAKNAQDFTSFRGVGVDTFTRGPDSLKIKEITINELTILVEFSHLFITQPLSYQPQETEQFFWVMNGEIYNYDELSKRVNKDATKLNDTQVFFNHVEAYGLESTLEHTEGMYSGILIYKDTGRCIGFTDPVGKKPLLVWNDGSGWHAGTGIDTNYIDEHSSSLQVCIPGIHEIDLKSGDVNFLSAHRPRPDCNRSISEILLASVTARIPKNLPFSVALSGGLDSSILAYIIEKQLHLTPEYFVIGEQLPDRVVILMEYLGIESERIKLIKPSYSTDLMQMIIETSRVVKSYNPSIISNGIATMMLAKAVHKDGYRVILSGEGADEFFCGYQAMYNGQYCPEGMRLALVRDLHFTELRRLDLICSHHAVEARCPFLDSRLTQHALSLAADSHCNSQNKTGKIRLRIAYKGLLPDDIIDAPKEPFDITSGLQKIVIDKLKTIAVSERNALKSIFKKVVGSAIIYEHAYFSEYPTFDEMIDYRARKYR